MRVQSYLTRILAGLVLATVAGLAGSAFAAQGGEPGRPVVFAGTLEVAVEDDFERGKAFHRYFMHESNLEQRFEIQLRGRHGKKERELEPGAKVQVRGQLYGDTLLADDDDEAVTVLEPASAEAAAPTTARKAIVMLVDITDSSNVKHALAAACDGATAQTAAIMFGYNTSAKHVDGAYQDSSFGAMGWGGSAYPGLPNDVVRVNISDVVTSCADASWRSKADAAATALGYTLSNYQHRVYVLPTDANCGWAGYAQVGCGSNCWAMVKAYSGASYQCGINDTFAHEIGHNVGMRHASTDLDNNGATDSTCPHQGTGYSGEYCDESDFMAISRGKLRTQNGPHKVQMGWTSAVDGTAGGTFTINALEITGGPQVVRVTPGSGTSYYLSYRVLSGYDATEMYNPAAHSYVDRLNIHRWGGSGNTYFIKTVGVGESFTDSGNGLTFTLNSRDATTANLTVSTSVVCNRLNPTVSISPSSQATNVLPATKTYTVTVTNRDSASCGSSLFNLLSSFPVGWAGSVSPAALTIGAGAASTTTLSVTAPAGAAQGSHTVGASTVADAVHGAVSASATLSIDTTLPTTPANLTGATAKGGKYKLTWNASSDASGIKLYRVYRNGTQIATSTTTTYTDSPTNGTWTYTVRAEDNAGNLSASSNSVTYTKSGRK